MRLPIQDTYRLLDRELDLDDHTQRQVMLAYSGGMDSTVLLHLLHAYFLKCGLKASHLELCAAHINHQQQKTAMDWEQHCRETCERLSIPFAGQSIALPPSSGENLESRMRKLRYRALCQMLNPGDFLLTAHHRNDQAETVLLRLLRGAGSLGLSAIHQSRLFEQIHLLRPLLNWSQEEVRLYAHQHRLHWVEDPANQALVYDRNYLRHRVIPLLASRWRHWDKALSRTAKLQQETVTFLNQWVDPLLEKCQETKKQLSIPLLVRHSAFEQRLILRRWLEKQNACLPSEKQLEYLRNNLYLKNASLGSVFCWKQFCVRRYRNQLYFLCQQSQYPETGSSGDWNQHLMRCEWRWQAGCDLLLDVTQQHLRWADLLKRAPQLVQCQTLTVRFRRGGERYLRMGKGQAFHQPLKKWFQAQGVPPWQRATIPLIFADQELRLVWIDNGRVNG